MKKWYSVVVTMVLALMLASPSFADTQPKDGPGNYIHSVTQQVKYFNSHPGEPSQWKFCGDDCGTPNGEPNGGNHATVSGLYDVEAWDWTFDKSVSNWGWGNDYGFAKGASMIGGELYTFADAEGYSRFLWFKIPNKAFQQGFITANAKTKAWSWAKDYGLTSKAGAGMKADEGCVFIEGSAFGKDGKDEYVSSFVKYGADFYQENRAEESGYNAGGIVATNNSSLYFVAYEPIEDGTFFGFHTNGSSYTPDAITKGKSEVTIDPYGSKRSIVGHTESMSSFAIDGCKAPQVTFQASQVAGAGVVSGGISNGPAFGAGTATYSFNGVSAGHGQADLNAVVNTNSFGGTSVMVTGSSSAVAQ